MSELNKDNPVSEGGRQEGSDKKQLEKVVLFFYQIHMGSNSTKTRLTYNCAHLRLTKESLTVEFANKNV